MVVVLVGGEINSCKLVLALKVKFSKNNISQSPVLETYKNNIESDNPYAQLRASNGKYRKYSFTFYCSKRKKINLCK